MIKPYPRIISFTILIIYFEKYMDGILKTCFFPANSCLVSNLELENLRDIYQFRIRYIALKMSHKRMNSRCESYGTFK